MDLIKRLFQKKLNSSIFASAYNKNAPAMNGTDFLDAYYKGWVYPCVNAIAEDVSTLELQLMRKTSRGEEVVENHIAMDLLHNVNPQMSSSELIMATQSFLELEGNTFWYVPKGTVIRKPAEIWTLDPTRVWIAKHQELFVSGYVYKNEAGVDVPLAVDEVIHFKRFNPRNRYRGIGTLRAAALAIDTDNYAAEWNKNFFYNSAMPAAALETEKTLSDEVFQRLKTQFAAKYGGIDNAHRTAVLEAGLKIRPLQISQKDMDFLEARKYSRDEILAAFRVPKSILGIVEDVNRANAEAQEYTFAKRVINPRMKFIVDRLNEFYLPLFEGKNSALYFTYKSPIPENEELILKKQNSSYGKWRTTDEVRELEKLPPLPNGEGQVIASLGPVLPEEAEEDEAQKSKKKTFNKAVKDKIVIGQEKLLKKYLKDSTNKYTNFLEDTKKSLLNKLNKQKSLVTKDAAEELVKLLFEDWNDWVGILYNSLKEDDELALAYGGKTALKRVKIGIEFDLGNERAQEWIEDTALKNAKSIVGTLKDDLRPHLLEAAKEGEGAQGVADVLVEQYSLLEEWKGLQIARSELTNAYSQGTLEGYRQSDVVESKKWLTVGNSDDDDCTANEAQGAIGLNDTFQSGDDAPGAHPNCRCCLLPVVKSE